MANGKIIRPCASGHVTLKTGDRLPVLIFKELAGSLLAVGQIIDSLNARAVFESTHMHIYKNDTNEILLTGTRCEHTKLWLVD